MHANESCCNVLSKNLILYIVKCWWGEAIGKITCVFGRENLGKMNECFNTVLRMFDWETLMK